MIDTGGEQRAWKAARSPACFENWLEVADVLRLRTLASIPQQIRNNNIDYPGTGKGVFRTEPGKYRFCLDGS